MKKIKSEVIIIGGGITGITLASSLAQSGISTILFEKQNIEKIKNNKLDGRASAITYRSKLFLEKYDLWNQIKKYSNPIENIKITDENSLSSIFFNNNLVENRILGYMIENHYILTELHQHASKIKNLQIIELDYTQIIRDSYKVIVKNDDTEYRAELLIAADGKFSNIRKLANIKAITHNYNQTAIVCNVSHELPHNNTAYEKFYMQGPFAILPLKGGKSSSIVWVEQTELAKIYLNMNQEELLNCLSVKFGKDLGKIDIISKLSSYNLSSLRATKYYCKRLALIGDAAHSIHPIAGQGLNLGIIDIEILVNLLIDYKKNGLDLGDNYLLTKYQNLRMNDNENMLYITSILNSIFSNNIFPVNIIRNIGLNIIEHLPIAKKFFMKYAMGLR